MRRRDIGLLGIVLTGLLLLALPWTIWPAGNCSVFKTWSTNEILTASDLNNSFATVGVTNDTPICADDYSSNVTQMRNQVDPFPGGGESLATSLAGEIERIRFVLAGITGNTYWYQDPVFALNADPFVPVGHLAVRNGDLTIGHSTVSTRRVVFAHAGTSHQTSFQSGHAIATVTYIWPTTAPLNQNNYLRGQSTGVLDWATDLLVGHPTTRTSQLVLYHSGSAFGTRIQASHATSEATYFLPQTTGNAGEVLSTQTSGSGALVWSTPPTSIRESFRGLHLRTHPDFTDANSKVQLLDLEEVIMDDGTRYSGLSSVLPLTADIAVAGAGGLDTGSELASTWYETYLIGKASTKAIADLRLLLHRAKDWFKDEDFTANVNNQTLRDAAARTKLAQGFKVDTTGLCVWVDVMIAKVGSPTGQIWVTLESDSAGSPSGTVLATSHKLDVSRLDAAAARRVRFLFNVPVSLTATTQYHLVLNGDFTISGVNHAQWNGDTTNNYANGVAKQFDGAAWSATATVLDFNFAAYIERNNTAVTMPSGWDQKVLLAPYPFNDAASNFRPSFDAQDKMVRLISTLQAATFTTDGNVLADVVASLPPRPLTVFIHGGQSVATVRSQIAGVPDGYRMTDTLVLDGGGAASQSPNVGGVFFPIGLIKTEAQSVYGRTGGGTLDVYVTEVEW